MDPHAELTELFAEACAAEPDEAARAVMTLHQRPDPRTLKMATKLLAHDAPRARSVAVDVIAQLGAGEPVMHEARFEALSGRLQIETTPSVLADLAIGMGHLNEPRVVGLLVPLSDHADAAVREGVAIGLVGQNDPVAVATLIALSADPEGEVRNWACFALGGLVEVDTPPLRAALHARLADEHREARHEALVGLARRGDTSVVMPLAAELATHLSAPLVEAAFELADPRLHPALMAARSDPEMTPWFGALLDEAIVRCDASCEV